MKRSKITNIKLASKFSFLSYILSDNAQVSLADKNFSAYLRSRFIIFESTHRFVSASRHLPLSHQQKHTTEEWVPVGHLGWSVTRTFTVWTLSTLSAFHVRRVLNPSSGGRPHQGDDNWPFNRPSSTGLRNLRWPLGSLYLRHLDTRIPEPVFQTGIGSERALALKGLKGRSPIGACFRKPGLFRLSSRWEWLVPLKQVLQKRELKKKELRGTS